MIKADFHDKSASFLAKLLAHAEVSRDFDSLPFSRESAAEQKAFFLLLGEYPSPLLPLDDVWDNEDREFLLSSQTASHEGISFYLRVQKKIEAAEEAFSRYALPRSDIFASKERNIKDRRQQQPSAKAITKLAVKSGDLGCETGLLGSRALLHECLGISWSAEFLTSYNAPDEPFRPPSGSSDAATFLKKTTDIWCSSVIGTCSAFKLARNRKTETFSLAQADKLCFSEVLGKIANSPAEFDSRETLDLIEFVLRYDGLNEAARGSRCSKKDDVFFDPSDGSNLFFFEMPLEKDALFASLSSGKNTMLPLMGPDFSDLLDAEFAETARYGSAVLSECLFLDRSPSLDKVAFALRSSRLLDAVREHGHLPDDPSRLSESGRKFCANGWYGNKTTSLHPSWEACAPLQRKRSAGRLGASGGSNRERTEIGEENEEKMMRNLESWFKVAGCGRSKSLLCVRKDVWLMWTSNWPVHRFSNFPTYECMLKQWRIPSSGFKLVDRTRKYNVLRKLLSWLTCAQETQSLQFVLGPDHVDFDEAYGTVFERLNMWRSSGSALAEELARSYKKPDQNGLLKSLVSALLIKKRHIVERGALVAVHDYLSGLDGTADAKTLAEIDRRHPLALHVLQTLKDRSTVASVEKSLSLLSSSPSSTVIKIPSVNPVSPILGMSAPPPTGKSSGDEGKKKGRAGGKKKKLPPSPVDSNGKHAKRIAALKRKRSPTEIGAKLGLLPSGNNRIATAPEDGGNVQRRVAEAVYISTSCYGWDVYSSHRGENQPASKKRKTKDDVEKSKIVKSVYQKILRNRKSDLPTSAMPRCNSEERRERRKEKKKSRRDPRETDFESRPLTEIEAHLAEKVMLSEREPSRRAFLADNVLPYYSSFKDRERRFFSVLLDNGCVYELEMALFGKIWNGMVEFENLKATRAFSNELSLSEGLAKIKLPDAWNGTNIGGGGGGGNGSSKHGFAEPLSKDFWEAVRNDVPKWLALGEYKAIKVLYALCDCELIPLELRKRLFFAIQVVEDSDVVLNKAQRGCDSVIAHGGVSNDEVLRDPHAFLRNVHCDDGTRFTNVGKMNPKGEHTCTSYSPAPFKPSHSDKRTGKKYLKCVDEARSKSRGALESFLRTMDPSASLGNKRGGGRGGTGARSVDNDDDDKEKLRPDRRKFSRTDNDWLCQDVMLFGGADRRRFVFERASKEDRDSTSWETARMVLGFVDYAYHCNFSALSPDGGKYYRRLDQVLLPYEPCYSAFKRRVVDESSRSPSNRDGAVGVAEEPALLLPPATPVSSLKVGKCLVQTLDMRKPPAGKNRRGGSNNVKNNGLMLSAFRSVTSAIRTDAVYDSASKKDARRSNPIYDDMSFTFFHYGTSDQRKNRLKSLRKGKIPGDKLFFPSPGLHHLETRCFADFLPGLKIAGTKNLKTIRKIMRQTAQEEPQEGGKGPEFPSTSSSPQGETILERRVREMKEKHGPWDEGLLAGFLRDLESAGNPFRLHDPRNDGPGTEDVWLDDCGWLAVSRYRID